MLKQELLKIVDFDYDKKINNIGIYGQNITTKALEIYNEFVKSNKNVVVITQDKAEAEELFSLITTLEKETYIYPEIDILKRHTAKSNDLVQNSIKVLENLVSKVPSIIIIPIEASYRTLKDPEKFLNTTFEINLDTVINFEDLQKKLVNMGYNRVDSVDVVGEFSKRGSIVDIFSPLNEKPIRLDFFDDELDSIRTFDEITQKSLEKVENVTVYPTNDFFLTNEEKDIVVTKILERLKDEKLKQEENYKDISDYLQEKIEIYRATGDFSELESFSNLIYEHTFSIADYFTEDVVIFFDNYHKITEKVESLRQYFLTNLQEINRTYIHQNIIDDNTFEKIQNKKVRKYYLSNLKLNKKIIEKSYNIDITDLVYYVNEEYLTKEIREKLDNDYKVLISLNTQKQRDYVEKILFDNYFYDDIYYGIKNGKIFIDVNKYHLKGFEDKKNKIFLLTPRELFTEEERKKRRVKFKYTNSEKIRNYQELNIGDYIVHISHGIGLYEGIENIEVNGVHKDFLKIVYDGGDVIYVDINNMNYIQKYTASTDNRKPQLNKLGTKKWQQVKNKVRREIEDISEDLIKLYIKRELSSGYAYSFDSSLQQEFEDDFSFIPTDDQLKATEEIKRDMEKQRPMDRLLCGDVGFGKTEVAMRVAFKAVMDVKQVAVLVPTTLLAEQHYENFVNRFANFPVNIEVVSRFKSAKDITEICKRLREGKIDIIIGTHKLLNDKFKYKDLGLLIIDEEQRFGVKHKEKIKHLKNTIDVLTLSATPIPRTLHMSLIGIRDLSVIETPPSERQPIQTFVTAQNNMIVKEAIMNEVSRGGQVFYVYNRVDSIDEKYLELKRLLPDINIAYAHGRMTQRELESIMSDVIDRKYDLLITTTIIETGIDISNVNTLIVEDADRFGLSQLYQLRGRVGRSSREAYAYLMYQPFKALTENSEKRLSAIKNFTTLGSGFKIAMQDLSIRGAGDVLGGRQHGFIDSVGYTLYSQMLEQEIQMKKGILEPILERDKTQGAEYYENIIKESAPKLQKDLFEAENDDFEIKLNVDAFIPKEYISSDAEKIDFYKRLNSVITDEEIDSIVEDLIDRFSDFGTEVTNLIDICYLKVKAKESRVTSVKELANKVIVTFEKDIVNKLKGKELFAALMPHKDVKIIAKDGFFLEIDKKERYSIRRIRDMINLVKENMEETNDKD
ncbi:transcription-repair coupling factor [Gemella morbillorum M424]|uniref:Transcription-repair-coupling factor n=3 Tax=Gemella morbillorum TaxID=29391 RepID=A0AAP9HDJ7_9BACL|nr:transcription-repair coupling factor [Gemella morbillorum]EFV35979.1 transcription-repair coupling factor [Gemella morbillorum M424]QGS09638.1 transcription-repair coupling factor [Gemella morbillorum]